MRGLNESVASSMNAGVDMMMIPPFQGATNIQLTADAMKEAVRSGTITE